MRAFVILAAVAVLAACTGPAPDPSLVASTPGTLPADAPIVTPSPATAPPLTPVPTEPRPSSAVAIDCGPMDPEACERRVASLLAREDPALVESITILDEKGSYTLCWTDQGCVTGIFD